MLFVGPFEKGADGIKSRGFYRLFSVDQFQPNESPNFRDLALISEGRVF